MPPKKSTAKTADSKVVNQANAINTPGTSVYTVINGSLDDVRTFFPVGCMHSLAARVSCDVERRVIVVDAASEAGLKSGSSVHHDPLPDRWYRQTIDVCLYVGQNVDTVIDEFMNDHGLRVEDTVESLRKRVIQRLQDNHVRVDPDGYIAPWYRTGGLNGVPRGVDDDGDDGDGGWGGASRPTSTAMSRKALDAIHKVQAAVHHMATGGNTPDHEPLSRQSSVHAAPEPGVTAGSSPAKPAKPPRNNVSWGSLRVAAAPEDGDPAPVPRRPLPSAAHSRLSLVDIVKSKMDRYHDEDCSDTFARAHLMDDEYDRVRTTVVRSDRRHSESAQEPIDYAWSTAAWRVLAERHGDGTVYDKGPVGENVCHLCTLIRSGKPEGHAVLKYLVETFGPRLVQTPYQSRRSREDAPGLFDGETILHISIVNKDYKLVQYLVEHGADVRARCFGSFFSVSGNCYYGEFPASFAVCNGQKEMVRYLVEKGAKINEDRDSLGNYALHLAVFHSRALMYDFLVDELGAEPDKVNADGHTPLTLAAVMNNVKMFDHLTKKHRVILWKYGPVTCANIPLRNIDSIQPVDDDKMCQSAIANIVSKGHLDLLSDSIVLEILRKKWDSYAWGHFVINGAFYLLLVISFTLLCQHYRHGLFVQGSSEVVVKDLQWSAANCRNDGVTQWPTPIANGSTVLSFGIGVNNCDVTSSLGYPGSNFDAESTSLEIIVLVGAICFLILEVWDMIVFARYRRRVQKLRERPEVRPPDLPALYPIPNTHIAKSESMSMERSKMRSSRKLKVEPHSSMMAGASALASVGAPFVAAWQFVSSLLTMNAEDSSAWAYLREAHPTTFFIWGYAAVIIYHFVLWATSSSQLYQPELAVASVLGWLYLLYFARGFQYIGHFVIMVFRILSVDLVKFGSIYLIFLGGFGVAAYVLVREEYISPVTQRADGDFSNLGATVLRLFRHNIGDYSFDASRENEGAPYLLWAIIFLFTITGNVVMFNLLIGLMANTFSEVSLDAERQWRLQWARIILLMERRWGPRPAGAYILWLLGSVWRLFATGGEIAEDAHDKFHTVEEVNPDFNEAGEQQELLAKLGAGGPGGRRGAAMWGGIMAGVDRLKQKALEEERLEDRVCGVCGSECALVPKRATRSIAGLGDAVLPKTPLARDRVAAGAGGGGDLTSRGGGLRPGTNSLGVPAPPPPPPGPPSASLSRSTTMASTDGAAGPGRSSRAAVDNVDVALAMDLGSSHNEIPGLGPQGGNAGPQATTPATITRLLSHAASRLEEFG